MESKRGTLQELGYNDESEWTEEEEGEDYFPTFEPELEGASAEGGKVIEEDDLIDILASYQDVRRALRQNHNARAWILSSGKSRLKGQGGSRQRQLFWTGSPPTGQRRRKAGQEQGHHRTGVEAPYKMPVLWQDRTLVERMPGPILLPANRALREARRRLLLPRHRLARPSIGPAQRQVL